MVTKSVVVVNKGGELKEVTFKDFDISNLYKKCGFRKNNGFELRHKYEKVKVNGDKIDIHVFSRNNGKSGTENKYDMPPPIDNDLYFGSFALVKWDRDDSDDDIDYEREEEEDDDSTSLPSGVKATNTILSGELPDDGSEEQAMMSPSTSPTLVDTDDDSDDETLDNKFEIEGLNEFLSNYHPESKQHNYDEIYALSKVVRDSSGIIIDELHRTLPIMSKYEKTRILGQRAKQLNSGNKPFISVPKNIMDGYLIAQEELRQKKLPFIIRRPLPNGGSEYWRIKDLEILY